VRKRPAGVEVGGRPVYAYNNSWLFIARRGRHLGFDMCARAHSSVSELTLTHAHYKSIRHRLSWLPYCLGFGEYFCWKIVVDYYDFPHSCGP